MACLACAGETEIVSANNQVGIQLISTDLDYDEYTGKYGTEPGLLSSESGANSGFNLSFSMMRDVLFGNDFIHLQYARSDGHTDYVGSTFEDSAGYGSLHARSSARVIDYSASYGTGFQLSPDFMLTPYVQIAHHEWERGVNNGQTYLNEVIALGLKPQLSVNSKLVLGANLMLGRTVDARINVDGVSSLYPSFKTTLGNSEIYKFGASADYAFTQHIHGNIGFDWMRFKYGDSPIVHMPNNAAVTDIFEPRSNSIYRTLSIGLGYAW
jgi:hypothetical protein